MFFSLSISISISIPTSIKYTHYCYYSAGFPTLMTDFQRSTRKGDLNCQKFMAIFTGILGTITNLTALSSYSAECYTNLPEEYFGLQMTYHLGPAFNCMLVATILKPIDVLIHLLTPVVPPENEEEKDGTASTGTGMNEALVGGKQL